MSAVDVLLGVALAVDGFVVVTLVCVLILAGLHVVLPQDSGAGEPVATDEERVDDREHGGVPPDPDRAQPPSGVDTEGNA